MFATNEIWEVTPANKSKGGYSAPRSPVSPYPGSVGCSTRKAGLLPVCSLRSRAGLALVSRHEGGGKQ